MAIPVTLEDARRQVRLEADDASRDDDLTNYIADAAAWVEKYTGHILNARDVTEQMASFDKMDLRAWPILPSAVPTITYAGPPVQPIAVTGARADVSRRPARLLPAAGMRFPFVPTSTMVTVTIRAGYESSADVPRNFKRAMLVLIAAYDADREGGDLFQAAVKAAERLCRDYRPRRI